jgi:hypothetical protein
MVKLARAKRVEMADILSKINSKDTLEILGCSASNVVKNRKHTQYNNNNKKKEKCKW